MITSAIEAGVKSHMNITKTKQNQTTTAPAGKSPLGGNIPSSSKKIPSRDLRIRLGEITAKDSIFEAKPVYKDSRFGMFLIIYTVYKIEK